MVKKCQACGTEKGTDIQEVYPYPEDDYFDNDPITPLFDMELQLLDKTFRKVTICHECFHKIKPDMWLGLNEWESLQPVTPVEQLEKTEA